MNRGIDNIKIEIQNVGQIYVFLQNKTLILFCKITFCNCFLGVLDVFVGQWGVGWINNSVDKLAVGSLFSSQNLCEKRPGMMVCVCNPSTVEMETGSDPRLSLASCLVSSPGL